MIQFPNKQYNIIYADPPWPYNESGTNAKVKDCHYKMMQLKDICALPVISLQAEKCILFLWVTMPRLPMAFEVMKAWGFVYHSLGFDWMKIGKNGNPIINPGYYSRQNNELCLIGVPVSRCRRMVPIVHDIRAAVVEERREHSRKPEIVRSEITRMFGAGATKIELFARERADGWDCWGEEAPVGAESAENAQEGNAND